MEISIKAASAGVPLILYWAVHTQLTELQGEEHPIIWPIWIDLG